MVTLKELYIEARKNPCYDTIHPYMEMVNDYAKNSPSKYISNLQYIIASKPGSDTFIEFVMNHGIPINAYDTIMECIDYVSNYSKKKHNVIPDYVKECKEFLKEYKSDNIHAFRMYEYLMENPDRSVMKKGS